MTDATAARGAPPPPRNEPAAQATAATSSTTEHHHQSDHDEEAAQEHSPQKKAAKGKGKKDVGGDEGGSRPKGFNLKNVTAAMRKESAIKGVVTKKATARATILEAKGYTPTEAKNISVFEAHAGYLTNMKGDVDLAQMSKDGYKLVASAAERESKLLEAEPRIVQQVEKPKPKAVRKTRPAATKTPPSKKRARDANDDDDDDNVVDDDDDMHAPYPASTYDVRGPMPGGRPFRPHNRTFSIEQLRHRQSGKSAIQYSDLSARMAVDDQIASSSNIKPLSRDVQQPFHDMQQPFTSPSYIKDEYEVRVVKAPDTDFFDVTAVINCGTALEDFDFARDIDVEAVKSDGMTKLIMHNELAASAPDGASREFHRARAQHVTRAYNELLGLTPYGVAKTSSAHRRDLAEYTTRWRAYQSAREDWEQNTNTKYNHGVPNPREQPVCGFSGCPQCGPPLQDTIAVRRTPSRRAGVIFEPVERGYVVGVLIGDAPKHPDCRNVHAHVDQDGYIHYTVGLYNSHAEEITGGSARRGERLVSERIMWYPQFAGGRMTDELWRTLYDGLLLTDHLPLERPDRIMHWDEFYERLADEYKATARQTHDAHNAALRMLLPSAPDGTVHATGVDMYLPRDHLVDMYMTSRNGSRYQMSFTVVPTWKPALVGEAANAPSTPGMRSAMPQPLPSMSIVDLLRRDRAELTEETEMQSRRQALEELKRVQSASVTPGKTFAQPVQFGGVKGEEQLDEGGGRVSGGGGGHGEAGHGEVGRGGVGYGGAGHGGADQVDGVGDDFEGDDFGGDVFGGDDLGHDDVDDEESGRIDL